MASLVARLRHTLHAAEQPGVPEAEPNPPRYEYSYRLSWTKTALGWDADRRQTVAQALDSILKTPEFAPNLAERRYAVPVLEGTFSGASLMALAEVLAALNDKRNE